MELFLFTKTINQIIEQLKKSYSLDVRALSIMRIGIGIILLVDLYIRSLSIIAFFTDEGVLPITVLKQYNWHSTYFSLHAICGELWWQILLFGINVCCIIFLILGYRTRLFTFICWVFLTSIQNRNPFILQGGDDLLRLLLFWGVFLPWGERFSIQKTSVYKNAYFSWSTIGYLMLVCSVFFFSALLKTSPEWRTEGTALYYALSLEQIKLPFGEFLYQFPLLLKVLTFIVFYIELLAPVLIVLPFVSYKIRLIGVLCYIGLFIGIASSLYVGLFYCIGIVSVLGMLPETVMDKFERVFYKNKTHYIENLKHSFGEYYLSVLYIKNLFLISVILFCLLMNLGSVKSFPFALDDKLVNTMKVFRLEQNWGMFSPYILKDDGWFVYSGYTINGKYIDIKHYQDTVSYRKPDCLVTEFESDRWRKFQENYIYNNNNFMRPFYCKYLLKKWNTSHPDKYINDLTIFYMKETTLPNYKTKPLQKLAVCNCQDK